MTNDAVDRSPAQHAAVSSAMLAATILLVMLFLLVAAQAHYNRAATGDARGPARVLHAVADKLESGFRRFGRFCARYLNVFEWIRSRIVVEMLQASRDLARPVWRIASSWVYAMHEMAYKNFWLSTSILVESLAWSYWPEKAPHTACFMAVVCAVSFGHRKTLGGGPLTIMCSCAVLVLVAYAIFFHASVLLPFVAHYARQAFVALFITFLVFLLFVVGTLAGPGRN